MSHLRWGALALGIVAAAAIGGCHKKTGRGTPSPGATATENSLVVQADRYSGTPGMSFTITAEVMGPSPDGFTFTWELSDGTSATGAMLTRSFAEPGSYAITVRASNTVGENLVGDVVLTVFDPTAPVGVFGEPRPPLPGDVDGDGTLSLADALRTTQHLAESRLLDSDPAAPGAPGLSFSELASADFDGDGRITTADAEMTALAVLSGQAVPSALMPSSVMPGQQVRVFSPALLDPAALIEIQIGAGVRFEPVRIVLGQVLVYVPLDMLTPGDYTETAGSTSVQVFSDGVLADELPLAILMPTTPPTMAEVEAVIDASMVERERIRAGMVDFFATPDAADLGFDDTTIAVLQSLFDQSCLRLDEAEAQLREDLLALPADQQTAVLRFLGANGFDAAIVAATTPPPAPTVSPLTVTSFSGFGPGAATLSAGALTALCTIKSAQDHLESLSTGTAYACTGLAALAVVALAEPTPFGEILSAPLLLSLSARCAQFLATQETASLVLSFLPTPGDRLKLDPVGPTTVSAGESVSVRASILVSNLAGLCGSGAGGGLDESLEERLFEPITERLLRRAPFRQLMAAARRISPQLAEQLEEAVEDAVGLAIGQTVGSVLESAVESLCEAIEGLTGGPYFAVDPTLIDVTAAPTSPGLIAGTSGPYFTVTCPTPAPGEDPETTEYAVTAALTLCGATVKGEIEVTCGELVDVTVTMGDNGALLDDIFEVSIDGDVVLSPGIPVTVASTVVQITSGTHTLQMRGLAAPDGIGTYFVSVDPGQLTDGPALSGTTLTAGTVFTWTLIVP